MDGRLTLVDLVVWFREFITVLDDGAVGAGSAGSAGGEGSWGSRPPRLRRVIEQRAGCAHEAVQLFVALCRGLGLRARYVACVDPVPPSPSKHPGGQTRHNTVDLAAGGGGGGGDGRQGGENNRGVWGRRQRQRQQQQQQQLRGGVVFSQAWAEVLCRDGGEQLVRRRRTGMRVLCMFLRGQARAGAPMIVHAVLASA